jgi:thiosulfate/3-mercaptopyruvate sulfurtransferase
MPASAETPSSEGPLVSPAWLAEDAGEVLVLDIRPADAFTAAHIAGAVHSDYAADGWRVTAGTAGGLLPDPARLAALFGRLGIEPTRPVVVVSAGQTPSDFSAAARVYWTLKVSGHRRVSILDGGFAAWTGAGLPTVAGPSQPRAAAPYPLRLDASIRAIAADVERAVSEKGRALVDGRSRAQFEGAEKSPQVARPGRLPGAVHVDHAQAFEAGTGRLRAPAQLEALFAPVPDGPAVSYCNTGHLASTNWFVLSEVLKRPGVTLYDGSMSEWAGDPAHPVEAGPESKP